MIARCEDGMLVQDLWVDVLITHKARSTSDQCYLTKDLKTLQIPSTSKNHSSYFCCMLNVEQLKHSHKIVT